MKLEKLIIQAIRQNGPVSFYDFMETALYHPELGYYNSNKPRIGIQGDYYTSCTYTSQFGILLARQLAEMYEQLATPQFIIVEYGAGTGNLCRDIVNEFQQKYPSIYDKLRYCIIEKSKRKAAVPNEKVCWYKSIEEIGTFSGCVISNELLDNFSVHGVIMQDELQEIFVGYENGFVELLQPAPPHLKNYFEELRVKLPNGFRTEINLEAIQWLKDIAALMERGYVLTIDYGFSSAGLYHESRREGTIVCYQGHTVNYYPYKDIGCQDITAHVNFSALCHWGQKNDLQFAGFTNQACFLLALGLGNAPEVKSSEAFLRDFLYDMGKKLKVLVLQKGVNKSNLMGLRIPLQL